MELEEKTALEARGYIVTDYAEFLGLSAEEQAIIEMRLALAKTLREQRISQGIPQSAVAAKVKTTQRRISLMENADKSISLDRLFVANFALGIKPSDLLQQMSASLSGIYVDHRAKRQVTHRKRQ